MLERVFGGGAKQPFCSVKSVAGMHDLVVLLAAVVSSIFFELARGFDSLRDPRMDVLSRR